MSATGTLGWRLQWVAAVDGRKKHIRVVNVSEASGFSELFEYALGPDAAVRGRGFKWDDVGKFFYCTIEDFLEWVGGPDGSRLVEDDITIDLGWELVAHADIPSDHV